MLYAWFHGCLRPMITAIEDALQQGEPICWRNVIGKQVSRLTNPTSEISGNLSFELSRTLERIVGANDSGAEVNADIREILRRAIKDKTLYGTDYKLEYGEPDLVVASFAQIVDDHGREATLIDEPIAYIAAINFFGKNDPGLIRLLGNDLFDAVTLGAKGTYLEYFSPALLTPVFHEKPLNPNLFKIKAKGNTTPKALGDKRFSIAGCNTGLQGIRHEFISMSEFLDAHCNNGSVRNSEHVPPIFFPKENPSGPDIVFVLRSEGQYYPVFAQSKISNHVDQAKGGIKHAHETTCYDCIKAHLTGSSLAKYCSKNIFFSLLFVPYYDQGRYPDTLELLEKAKEPLQKYAFTTQTVEDENKLGIVSESSKKGSVKEPVNTSQAMENIDRSYKVGRLNKRKAIKTNVEGSGRKVRADQRKGGSQIQPLRLEL
ncbi:hypothetical protein BGZ76_009570 [Entomortierella beljakovae]|nr:hypothetical protein BGZ76_009570 [Entomortierella beljakovae]